MTNKKTKENTHKRKSCSHAGLAPLTVMVVDLTFCNWRVTYVLSWLTAMEKKARNSIQTPNDVFDSSIQGATRAVIGQSFSFVWDDIGRNPSNRFTTKTCSSCTLSEFARQMADWRETSASSYWLTGQMEKLWSQQSKSAAAPSINS